MPVKLFVFIALGLLGACGISRAQVVPSPAAPEAAPLPGELETRALAEAYPDRVAARQLRGGQWSVRVGDRWYAWAEGRMLPEDEREAWASYAPLRFYPYYRGPRRSPELSPELVERLKARNRAGNRDDTPRSDAFLDGLYGISSEAQAERAQAAVRFLGTSVRVHPLLARPLARVEERILAARGSDPSVGAFLDGVAQVQGYHWREIAGTARRSYHGYGAALDIVPRSYRGRYAYWRWAFDAGVEEWWSLPDSRIWLVPDAVVDAFEAEGFVWGGKWLWFDTVHFEYRPEVLRLAELRPGPG